MASGGDSAAASSLHAQAVELLNDAKLGDKDTKLNKLSQVQEILFHRDQSLQGELIPAVADFQLDSHAAIRRWLVNFIETVSKQIPKRECRRASFLMFLFVPWP